MRANRNTESWSATARILHWMMALMIITQYLSGWIADRMESSPAKADLMTGHKSLGITLLLLLLLRAAWRWTHPAPPPPAGAPAWEHRVSAAAHGLLYLLMAAVPLSGWLVASTSIIPWKYWWLFQWPSIAETDKQLHTAAENAHALLFWILLAVVALHIAAALRHHFIKKNNVLVRMIKGETK